MGDCPPWNSLISMAQAAPSGDNCQPWVFFADGCVLSIFIDKEIEEHFLNRNSHASLISLGCVLEILRIGAAECGWRFDQKKFDREQLGVELCFYPVETKRQELLSYIDQRYTYRGFFKKADFSLLESVSFDAGSPCCGIEVVYPVGESLKRAMSSFDSLHWRYDQFRVDLLKWIHLTADAWKKSRDGFSLIELGLGLVDRAPLFFMKKFKAVRSLFSGVLGWVAYSMYSKWLQNSLGIVFFTSTKSNDEALLEVGSVAYRFWLQCTRSGLAVQPLTNISLGAWEAYIGVSKLQDQDREQGRLLYRQIKGLLGLGEGQSVIWAFRVGVPQSSSGRVSLRRKVSVQDGVRG